MESLYYFFDCYQYVASFLIDAVFCIVYSKNFTRHSTTRSNGIRSIYNTLSLLFAYFQRVVYKCLHFHETVFRTPTAWHWNFVYSYEHLHGECHGFLILYIKEHTDIKERQQKNPLCSNFLHLRMCHVPFWCLKLPVALLVTLKPTSGSTQMSPFLIRRRW